MRREGETVHATGGSAQNGRRSPHAQTHAQRPESRAHALRLVVRTHGIVGTVARQGPALAGRLGRAPQPILAAVATRVLGSREAAWRCRMRRGGRAHRSNRIVDDLERGSLDERRSAHVLGRGGVQHDAASDRLTLEEPEQALLRQRLGTQGLRLRDSLRELARTADPTRRRVVRRSRNSRSYGGCPRSPGLRPARECRPPAQKPAPRPVPSSLLMTRPATPTLPPSLRKYSTAEQTLFAT